MTALCLTISGFAQMNIWSGNKLIYSISESNVDSVTFGERQAVEELTFELSVTDLNAVSAHVKVTPSNQESPFIWLCQPTSAYEGMTGQEIANKYVEINKTYLDQNMGLYFGNQDYEGYGLLPETEYFLIAFGYNQGITSAIFEQRFETPAGTAPAEFSCEINFPDIQGERIKFNVKPNDNTIYYFCAAFVKEDYSESEALKLAQATIDETYKSQIEYNPNYPIEQVVENVCYHGESNGELAPLTGGTEYTFFAVPVTSKGKTVGKVITKDFKTLDIKYSEANVGVEYLGSFDFLELKENGHFTNHDYDETKIVMVFRLNANEQTNHVKYKLWYGATEATDSELIGYIGDYWDGQRDKQGLQDNYLVYIVNQYHNSVTFVALPSDSEGINGMLSRTFVDAIAEGDTGTVAEFEEIQKLIPSAAPAKSPKLDISK